VRAFARNLRLPTARRIGVLTECCGIFGKFDPDAGLSANPLAGRPSLLFPHPDSLLLTHNLYSAPSRNRLRDFFPWFRFARADRSLFIARDCRDFSAQELPSPVLPHQENEADAEPSGFVSNVSSDFVHRLRNQSPTGHEFLPPRQENEADAKH
jgi:hypothetical protein